jgi:hypothetical protein
MKKAKVGEYNNLKFKKLKMNGFSNMYRYYKIVFQSTAETLVANFAIVFVLLC